MCLFVSTIKQNGSTDFRKIRSKGVGYNGPGKKQLDFDGNLDQRCGLRPSVLGQDRSETKKSVLVLVLVLHSVVLLLVLVLQV